MTLSALTVAVIAAVLALVALAGLWAYGTANRLDRLHVRTDLAWQALDAALARRAVVVRGLAQDVPGAAGTRLVELSLRAERVDRADRERAENALSRALAMVDPSSVSPGYVSELADADARVLIARRFHNDAVRDTQALQGRRLVRWLRLGGTAGMPPYFDITEETLRTGDHRSSAPPEDGPTEPVADNGESAAGRGERVSSRLVIIDPEGRTLLVSGRDPQRNDSTFWFTFGGGIEPGESLRDAAVRELREETGLEVAASVLCGPVWRRLSLFEWNGRMLRSQEHFFVLRTEPFTPEPGRRTDLEHRALGGHRWFTAAELAALAAGGVAVYPHDLAALLPEAIACWDGGGASEVRTIR